MRTQWSSALTANKYLECTFLLSIVLSTSSAHCLPLFLLQGNVLMAGLLFFDIVLPGTVSRFSFKRTAPDSSTVTPDGYEKGTPLRRVIFKANQLAGQLPGNNLYFFKISWKCLFFIPLRNPGLVRSSVHLMVYDHLDIPTLIGGTFKHPLMWAWERTIF